MLRQDLGGTFIEESARASQLIDGLTRTSCGHLSGPVHCLPEFEDKYVIYNSLILC